MALTISKNRMMVESTGCRADRWRPDVWYRIAQIRESQKSYSDKSRRFRQTKSHDFSVAIGNPFDLAKPWWSGSIVSAQGRSGLNLENFENFIQTDAAINSK